MDVLIFGDSITQGAFDDECGGWANRLAAYKNKKSLKNNLKDRSMVFNLGISGEDIKDISTRFQSELKARTKSKKSAAIIFAIGVNDSKVNIEEKSNQIDIETYEKTLEEMIESVNNHHTVACVGLVPIDDSNLDPMPWNPKYAYKVSEVKKYDQSVQKVAEKNECLFIPMLDVFEKHPEKYLIDGIHPNAEGHRLIFERVKDALEKEHIL